MLGPLTSKHMYYTRCMKVNFVASVCSVCVCIVLPIIVHAKQCTIIIVQCTIIIVHCICVYSWLGAVTQTL